MAIKDVIRVWDTFIKEVDTGIWGRKWADNNVTFSFPTTSTSWTGDYSSTGERNEPYKNYVALNDAQKAAAREALNKWASVCNLQFTEVPDGQGVIRFGTSSAPSTSWAYSPNNTEVGGDVWFGNANSNAPSNPIAGNYSYAAYIHEIGHALGLKHPHEYGLSHTGQKADTSIDSMENFIMSYRSYLGASADTGYTNGSNSFATSPMMYDIAAIQYLYGANFSGPSNKVYNFDPNKSKVFETIWDGGGNATYDCSLYTTGVQLNLRPGEWSNLSSTQLANLGNGHIARGNVANAFLYNNDPRSLIANAIGGSGNDVLIGNQAANYLNGGAGNDNLQGGMGNDTIKGGTGDNTALFEEALSNYVILNANGKVLVSDVSNTSINSGNDILDNIQHLKFTDTTVGSSYNNFDPLQYIASYGDLITAYRTNTTLGQDHYVNHGFSEGRRVRFDALQYVASYGDLINAFGTNITAAETHYIGNGYNERRVASFDALKYIASYGDLISAFGSNITAGETHFIKSGYRENRVASFDALKYIASYGDLISSFGSNITAGERHFIKSGYREGRIASFNASQYLASNADLRQAFGNDLNAATLHYINYGYREHRNWQASAGRSSSNTLANQSDNRAISQKFELPTNDLLYGTTGEDAVVADFRITSNLLGSKNDRGTVTSVGDLTACNPIGYNQNGLGDGFTGDTMLACQPHNLFLNSAQNSQISQLALSMGNSSLEQYNTTINTYTEQGKCLMV